MASARQRKNPRNGTADNRRDDLVRAAAQLFRKKGFEGTTIRDIAGAVGMRSGSPFYHFANKHELLMAVMEEGLRLGLERPARRRRPALDLPSASPPRARALRDPARPGADFIPVMLYDWRSLPAQYKRRIIGLKDGYDAIWQKTLDDLHAEGRLHADARLARLMILGAINFSATWYRAKGRAAGRVDLDALADQTVALVLHEGRA